MENDRPCPLLIIMWFQHPVNTAISGWQTVEDLHFTFIFGFCGLHQTAQCHGGNEWLLYVAVDT